MTPPRPRRSILFRVLILVLPLAVAAHLGVAVLAQGHLHDHLQRIAHHDLEEAVSKRASAISQELHRLTHTIEKLADNKLISHGLIDVEGRDDYLAPFFASLKLLGLENVSYTLVDYRGRRIAGNDDADLDKQVGESTLAQLIERNESRLEVRRPRRIFVAAPVMLHGRAEGALLAEGNAEEILRVMLAESPLLKNLAVLDDSRTVLFSADPGFLRQGEHASQMRDEDLSYAQQSIPGYPDLRVMLFRPLTLTRAAQRTAIGYLAAAMSLAMLVALGGLVFTAVLVQKPIRRFASELVAMRRRGYDSDKLPPQDSREFHELAEAFNALAVERRTVHRQLRAARDDLEEKVHARTRELSHRNSQLLIEVEQRRLAESRLAYHASHDKLTGMLNRGGLLRELDARLQGAERERGGFAVCFLDFDRFKYVNDSYGHDTGDALLCEIARRMNRWQGNLPEAMRENTLFARLGGDEFVVVLAPVRPPDAMHWARRLCEVFTEPCRLNRCAIRTSASIGVVTSDLGHDNAHDLLRDADTAMYQAKERGRACVVRFDISMHNQVLERLELENDLRYAIDNEGLDLAFQPIFELEELRLLGFEALCRWNHPRLGDIPPDRFIALAEETGLIEPLGRWVLRRAAAYLQDWRLAHPAAAPFYVSVNVSKLQLLTPHFASRCAEDVADHGLRPADIRLEITESTCAASSAPLRPTLDALVDEGFHLMMDDFGCGASSLSELHAFPIRTLKIDRSFVSRLGDNRKYSAIVYAVATLARNLDLAIIAEGVETQDQLTQLQALDCSAAQGFYLGRPMPAQDAETLLADAVEHPAKRVA